MGFVKLLEKMKLVQVHAEVAEEAPPEGPVAGRRTVLSREAAAVEDLLRDLPPPVIDEAALAAAPAAPATGVPDFPSIYKAAGIAEPAHGFSALKVLEILQSPDFEGLDGKAKAAALAGFLKMNPAGPVAIADVLQDAVRRDQALDRFEEFLHRKLVEKLAQLDADSARLQQEIDELARRNQEAIAANRRAAETEHERFTAFQGRKRGEERRLFEAVSPFVEANPVTVAEEPAATPRAEE